MIYQAKFIGRRKGAVSALYWIATEVEVPEGSTPDEVRARLYERFDDVARLELSAVEE